MTPLFITPSHFPLNSPSRGHAGEHPSCWGRWSGSEYLFQTMLSWDTLKPTWKDASYYLPRFHSLQKAWWGRLGPVLIYLFFLPFFLSFYVTFMVPFCTCDRCKREAELNKRIANLSADIVRVTGNFCTSLCERRICRRLPRLCEIVRNVTHCSRICQLSRIRIAHFRTGLDAAIGAAKYASHRFNVSFKESKAKW